MTNIKNFDLNLLKIDKKLHKNIEIYYFGYITVKDSGYAKIKNADPLYLVKQMDTLNEKMKMNI